MSTWHFYDPSTGIFVGKSVSVRDEDDMLLSKPDGLEAHEGDIDHLSQRVDLATGQLVDYQPPAPSQYHEWNAELKRWRPSAAMMTDAESRAALKAIDEKRARAFSDFVLNPNAQISVDGKTVTPLQRLQDLESEAQALRAKLLR